MSKRNRPQNNQNKENVKAFKPSNAMIKTEYCPSFTHTNDEILLKIITKQLIKELSKLLENIGKSETSIFCIENDNKQEKLLTDCLFSIGQDATQLIHLDKEFFVSDIV